MQDKDKVTVIAGLRIKDGFGDKFLEAAAPVVEATRKEAGCLRYDILRDAFDPQKFYYMEEYVSDAAFQAHRAAPYMSAFKAFRDTVVDKYYGVNTYVQTASR